MDNVKSLIESKTVWTSFFAFIAAVMKIFGKDLGIDPNTLADQVLTLINLVLPLFAVYFRKTATTQINAVLPSKK